MHNHAISLNIYVIDDGKAGYEKDSPSNTSTI